MVLGKEDCQYQPGEGDDALTGERRDCGYDVGPFSFSSHAFAACSRVWQVRVLSWEALNV